MERVYLKKTNCCACGVCQEVCPTKAISFSCDEYGYMYPVINQEKCIDCNSCKNHCPMIEVEKNQVKKTYAAICTNNKLKEKSASGGVFAALAEKYINRGAIVCGAAVCIDNGIVKVQHKCIDNLKDLELLQGSKYVQSNITCVLKEIKEYLLQGREVLFSGTPCQVAAVYKYLGKKAKNLITVDLICHGTPSPVWWSESLQILSKKLGGSIIEISFRDSDKWMMGHIGHIKYIDHMGHIKFSEYSRDNVYYDLFLKGETFRESCYECPFANEKRVADITIGDFWGFDSEHNQAEIEKNSGVNLKKGLSCVIVNTEEGQKALENTSLWLYPTLFEKAYKHNAQLQKPSVIGKNRKMILALYKHLGYGIVDKFCRFKMYIWKRIHHV